MMENYLKVTESLKTTRKDLFRKVECVGKKATMLANQYQSELNGGRGWQDLALNNEKFFNVVAIPYAQAREYRDFEDWGEKIPLYTPLSSKVTR